MPKRGRAKLGMFINSVQLVEVARKIYEKNHRVVEEIIIFSTISRLISIDTIRNDNQHSTSCGVSIIL